MHQSPQRGIGLLGATGIGLGARLGGTAANEGPPGEPDQGRRRM